MWLAATILDSVTWEQTRTVRQRLSTLAHLTRVTLAPDTFWLESSYLHSFPLKFTCWQWAL